MMFSVNTNAKRRLKNSKRQQNLDVSPCNAGATEKHSNRAMKPLNMGAGESYDLQKFKGAECCAV